MALTVATQTDPTPAPTGSPAPAATSVEQSLSDVLAHVVGADQVSPDAHFFDDLGADSMLMARFCARARKRADLPSVSIKDVYQHPTITSLATALAPRPDSVEGALADVLAEVVGVEQVSPDAHFFDDLGADSMLMARFCARVRKRPDVPSVSIKDVYAHPTARSLAAALPDLVTEPVVAVAPPPAPEPPARASMAEYVLCGTLQALFFVGYGYLAMLISLQGYEWILASAGLVEAYLRSAAFGSTLFLAACTAPIVAKWILIGRWTRRQIPAWTTAYVRFWIVKTLVRANPLVLFFDGSPLYVLYLRALGAKIGRRVVILTRHVPVCTDLLTIGDGTVIRKDAFLNCYRAHAGTIQTGSVTLGRNVVLGENSVLDVETAMGDGAQLGLVSSLHPGQAVSAGEHWHGSPAQRTDVDYRGPEPLNCGTGRRVAYGVLQLLRVLAVYLPLAVGFLAVLITLVPSLARLESTPFAITSWQFYVETLITSSVMFFGVGLVGLVLTFTVPRVLDRALEPDRTYRLFGIHYALHRSVERFTNHKFFTALFGDSSYIVPYLRAVGYKLMPVVQTGSNFGTQVKHDNPYLVSIGTGTVCASELSILNAQYSSTSFRVTRARIGANNFLGNSVTYPAQSTTGDDCLLATKVLVPIEGEIREGVGLLGSPSFEIPRTVERDSEFVRQAHGDDVPRLLAAKNRHNLVTIGIHLLSRWCLLFVLTLVFMAVWSLEVRLGTEVVALIPAVVVLPFTLLYGVLVERVVTGFRPLQPTYCSIYDIAFWRIERLFKNTSDAQVVLNGTPFKAAIWRLLGVRVGRRLLDDGCGMADKAGLVTIGDDVTLNAGSSLQCHSQEDYAFKNDRITVGSGCTVGVGAFVFYGAVMGDGSVLAPDSFLMKGEEVPPHESWGGNPAREMPAVDPFAAPARETGATAAPAQDLPREMARPMPRPMPTSDPRVPPVRQQDDHSCRPRRRTVTTLVKDPREMPVEPGRDHWQGVLTAGGNTTLPRWTLDPAPGVAEHEVPIPAESAVAARRRAYELAVPLRTVLLAVHAKVLAALSGEREVVTGYVVDPVVRPLPCRLTTEPASWRDMVQATRRTESALRAYGGFPLDDLRRELDLPGPSFEVVFDPAGLAGMSRETVLDVGFPERQDRLVMQLRYRTDVLNAECAARIAGYYLAALALITANPDAEHRRQSLLSAEEYRFQRDGLAGPLRELPDRRVHELFEQRVAAHPDAVAGVHRGRELTYRELNARANRLGRALLARGLPREAVVAVVMERNLDWMAAVLGIWKAGLAYLPVEPHFPAARVATALARAACPLVLTEHGSSDSLDRALDTLPGIERLLVGAAFDEGHADGDLGVAVGPDQLAYVLFTSGSTGEPKGVMCEHAGMENHIVAKLDDLAVVEGDVIPQTGPQCFDISVWQLVGALLVGGRSLLVEQEAILDVERFLDTIVDGRAAVLQVVPSYLDVILTHLEQRPRALPDLHTVCPTGDFLKRELVQRWFAAQPGIPLVNTYGLTETSDDAVHAVMDRLPETERIPLGRPIINTHVDVVDEEGVPVPLGAPGLIVFSGVCVGRGYINDPERTARVFGPDPLRPGQRVCRTGDHGRWNPDGTLDFLGRRDNQVKIRGFRIEIGEVENALLRVPGVRDGAAVVTNDTDRIAQLVGFYSGPQPLDNGALRERLVERLPEYMVPSTLYWRETLPLTANGKIDRTTLAGLAAELAASGEHSPPRTPTEHRLAAAWALVLDVPSDRVGRHDHFFDRGGTSLSAVKLAVALNRAVSPKDLAHTPVLADLAELLDGRRTRAAEAVPQAAAQVLDRETAPGRNQR